MLMKSPTSTTAAGRVAQSLDAISSSLWLAFKRLYTAIKHRRDISVLADQDEHLLADIGLTRADVSHAIAQPLWRDPTEILAQRAHSRWRRPSMRVDFTSADDPTSRALAALDDSELMHLSELGRRARHRLAHVCVAGLLAGLAALSGPTDARAESVCKPALAISDVRLSAMQPPTLQRKWTALVTVDASRCAENSRGTFEIGFSRLKENAPEVDFHERFRWQAPSVKVEFDFWADEAVERYWLDSIAPCSCRR